MVKAWKETVVIPTYEVGKPEKNPIFLEKRVYQGSSGVVYPYPVIESIFFPTWEAAYRWHTTKSASAISYITIMSSSRRL